MCNNSRFLYGHETVLTKSDVPKNESESSISVFSPQYGQCTKSEIILQLKKTYEDAVGIPKIRMDSKNGFFCRWSHLNFF